MCTMGRAFLWIVLCVHSLASAAQNFQPMPRVEGESLAGHHVVLPEAAMGKVVVLVFGFTKASKVPTSAWGKRISGDFATETGFALYQLPVLEAAPRLIRGFIISGMKRDVPENMRDHFIPVLSGEANLKKLVNYKEADDAYLLVLDREGKIMAQQHGAVNDASYSQLRGEITKLLNGAK